MRLRIGHGSRLEPTVQDFGNTLHQRMQRKLFCFAIAWSMLESFCKCEIFFICEKGLNHAAMRDDKDSLACIFFSKMSSSFFRPIQKLRWIFSSERTFVMKAKFARWNKERMIFLDLIQCFSHPGAEFPLPEKCREFRNRHPNLACDDIRRFSCAYEIRCNDGIKLFLL